MSYCIICGGSGFIGSHLLEFLLSSTNYNIIVIDDLSSGKISNIIQFLEKFPERCQFHKSKVEDFDLSSLSDYTISFVIHLASRASPVDFVQYPLDILSANSIGTKRLLDFCKITNSRFIFASTSEIYGDPEIHPQPETYVGKVNPIGIRSCYDESKRFGESLCMSYYRQFGLDIRIIRIFNVFGPRMNINDGRVIPSFINQIISNKPIKVNGDGSQTRSFCYVTDFINGLYQLISKDCLNGEVFNLGNDYEISIVALAERIKNLAHSHSEIIFNSSLPDDPTRRKPDLSKVKKTIHWKPKSNLSEGLLKTLDYFQSLKY